MLQSFSSSHRFFFSLFLFFTCAVLKIGAMCCAIHTEHFPTIGLFAAANLIIGQISLYEKGEGPYCEGLIVDFGRHGLYYDPAHGPNWWTYFFEPISIGKKPPPLHSMSWEEGCDAFRAKSALPREEVLPLVNKYIRVHPYIQRKAKAFADEHFDGVSTIGVHYRGTDKFAEAPRIDYDAMIWAVKEQLPARMECQIFVATDEAPFLERMEAEFPSQIVARQVHRSTGPEGVHFSSQSGYELGEEALIDALLLSKCDLLIRTSSNLSLWSTYFNPDLPVILLSRRYDPCAEPE